MSSPAYLDSRFKGRYSMRRGWMDDPLFQGESFTRAQAYEWLVGNAMYKSGKVKTCDGLIHLERGQLSFSLRFLIPIWGWEKGKIDHFLHELADEGYIRLEPKTKRKTRQNVITICAYDEIQGNAGSVGTLNRTSQRRLNDNCATNKKKDNKANKDINSDWWKSPLEVEVGSHEYRLWYSGVAYKDGVLTVKTDHQQAYIKRYHEEALLSVFGEVRVESLLR